MSETEESLVARCQQGDRQAFERMVGLYQRRVFGIAYGIVRNPDDALDLSQETFLRAFCNIRHFKGDSRLYTWLYRITVNVSLDFINKRKRTATLEHDDSRLIVPDEMAGWPMGGERHNPVEKLDKKELAEVMSRGLEKLSEKHRVALILREVEGLSYEEMAEVLEINVGTVMSRLFHARHNMQRILQGYIKGDPQS
jgi:RNA polymerase sigma-70 factor (ECF subfamily)